MELLYYVQIILFFLFTNENNSFDLIYVNIIKFIDIRSFL